MLWCDNIGALALASNPVYHTRTKHIEVKYHIVREKVVNKDIIAKFISTHDQLADIFTKGLTSARFSLLHDKLQVVEPSFSLRGAARDKPSIQEFESSTKSPTHLQLPDQPQHSNSNLG